MRESRTFGSARGVPRKGHIYSTIPKYLNYLLENVVQRKAMRNYNRIKKNVIKESVYEQQGTCDGSGSPSKSR